MDIEPIRRGGGQGRPGWKQPVRLGECARRERGPSRDNQSQLRYQS